jgi:hypothetical protein
MYAVTYSAVRIRDVQVMSQISALSGHYANCKGLDLLGFPSAYALSSTPQQFSVTSSLLSAQTIFPTTHFFAPTSM